MLSRFPRCTRTAFVICFALSVSIFSPTFAIAEGLDAAQILERLEALEKRQRKMEEELSEKDARIVDLERELKKRGDEPVLESIAVEPGLNAAPTGEQVAAAPSPAGEPVGEKAGYGQFNTMGRGFKLADTPYGDVNFSLWTYMRYLNQNGLDEQYTDSFGREFDVDIRNDVQVNKVNITFKGWIFDPDLRYRFYTWTSNTSQGDSAQVVVAGNLQYRINDMFNLGVGIDGLPGSRSLWGTFPLWTKVDSRSISEEYFRPSYTTGVWSNGTLAEGLKYKLMLGNNLSQLGVNAKQLDDDLNTISGTIHWMPTTGEYGPNMGWGDFEYHEEVATLVGLSGTQSREDRQSQPDTEDIQNSQIRLSDGTIIFSPDAFASGGRINRARYRMLAADAGMKYRGFNFDTSYFWRWVDDLKIEGDIPEEDLFDHGFQVHTGYMFIPKTLQGYFVGAKIFGEYGDPWETTVGLNWYPFHSRQLRVNGEVLYLKESPVGYSSVPFSVGADGAVFNTNVELYF